MNRTLVRNVLLVVLGALLGLGARYAPRVLDAFRAAEPEQIPTTRVRRGDVTFTVYARGQLQGGNSRMLTAPMTGSAQHVLTDLRKPGELVAEGDVVARFDTTEENFKLREAEADLAEATEQVRQAENEALAREEELNYELIKARGDLEQAELDVRRNPLLAAIAARQNDLALAGARDRLSKIESDYPERKAAAKASIAIQGAAKEKARVQAETARRNIDMMTLTAPAGGYVNVERNSNTNFFFSGMVLPLFQVGDQVRPGMAVAQIPDMANWEVTAQVAEQDRGHLTLGKPAAIRVAAMPQREFRGRIKDLGATSGPAWERRFECKLTLENSVPELRPGMSAAIGITADTLTGVLWLPAQAVFERDGRLFVYARAAGGFQAKDVQLTRRSESQVVIAGLAAGEEVALASPGAKSEKKSAPTGAAKAVAQ